MSRIEPHSRLLTEAARTVLGPIGMFQKGRSRTWLDDHGWWIGVVEFQPSGFCKGSYLNVAAMWLWNDRLPDNCISFEFSFGLPRVEELIQFETEEQFAPEAYRLALLARDKITELREKIRTCRDAANQVAARSREPWDLYHSGIAYACVGEGRQAKKMFDRLGQFRFGMEPEPDWVLALRVEGRYLANMLDNLTAFREHIENTIHETRRKLKLPELANSGLC